MYTVLINPRSEFLIRQDVMAPLGLWYLKTQLENAGHETQIVDLGLGDTIPQGADVYGLTGTSAQLKELDRVANILSGMRGLKIAGGPHATLDPQFFFDRGFDTVVQHEGDAVVVDVVEGNLSGLVTAPRNRNIDDFYPDRSQQSRYSYSINGIPAVTMMTSRGCPYNCAFCSKDVWGRMYVSRSLDSVVREIYRVYPDYKAIMFYDDTFVLNRKRLFGICDVLRKLGIVWRGFARTDQADREMLQYMKDSGCAEIGVGIESGSATILKNINKLETPETHLRAVELAHEIGLRVKGFVIVGLPGETWETVNETDEFLSKAQLDDVDISILTVYHGSDIYKHPEKYDVTFGDPSYYKGKPGEYECRVRTSAMTSEEIVQAREMLHKKHKEV